MKPEEKEKELADDADGAVADEAVGAAVDETVEEQAAGEETVAGETGMVVTGEEHVEVTDSIK